MLTVSFVSRACGLVRINPNAPNHAINIYPIISLGRIFYFIHRFKGVELLHTPSISQMGDGTLTAVSFSGPWPAVNRACECILIPGTSNIHISTLEHANSVYIYHQTAGIFNNWNPEMIVKIEL